MTAQFMPLGDGEPHTAMLQYRPPNGGAWKDGPTAEIGAGYSALFRLEDWDSGRDWEYRVAYTAASGQEPVYYAGTIRRDPARRDALTIGLFSCILAVGRALEGGVGRPELPQAELLGR
jgi:alkaline phosphatase D